MSRSRKVAELRALLSGQKTQRGKVLAVEDTTVRVATSAATATARLPPGLQVKLGDVVKIQDGLVIGLLRDVANLPVYDL